VGGKEEGRGVWVARRLALCADQLGNSGLAQKDWGRPKKEATERGRGRAGRQVESVAAKEHESTGVTARSPGQGCQWLRIWFVQVVGAWEGRRNDDGLIAGSPVDVDGR
jgi:hypothetical protein